MLHTTAAAKPTHDPPTFYRPFETLGVVEALRLGVASYAMTARSDSSEYHNFGK